MITQHLVLDGDVWMCPGCGERLHDSKIVHEDECPGVNGRYPRCPTPCDDECEQPCHEVHLPRHKRDHNPDGCMAAIVAAVVKDERERIRQLAIRNGAVCTGDEGTSCYFADLLDGGS